MEEQINLQEQLVDLSYKIYKKMLPSVISTYGNKFCSIDNINTLDDFKNAFYLVVYDAVCLYDATHVSKGGARIIEWKKNNGNMKHKMKIETFVIEQLKKELDKRMNFDVVIKKEDYVETISYSSFVKKRAYLKANGYEIEFLRQETPFSTLASKENGNDESYLDPEHYRVGLKDEINEVLYK